MVSLFFLSHTVQNSGINFTDLCLIVVSTSQDTDFVFPDFIDKPVFLVNSAGPASGQFML